MTLPIIGHRRRPPAAVILGAGLVLLAAVLVGLSLLARQPGYPLQPIMIAIPSAAVGVLVARRQPRNPNGWLLIGIAAAILLSTGAGAYSLLVYRLGRSLPLGPAGLVLYQLWSPALALFLLVILLFPDGHPPSPRWRWAAWAYGLLCVVYLGLLIGVAGKAIEGHRIRVDGYGGLTVVDYPVGRFAVAQNVILVLILVLGLCFAGRQFVSWRHSTGVRREQLKWLMFGSAVAIVCAALSIPGQTTPSGIWAALNSVLSIGFIALPVSIGVGILRYRLYEIDQVISRTVAYAIVTGLLVGVYTVLVTTAHRVFTDRSPPAVAGATLAAVALFNPLRRRVQRVVDRRFNRAHYDAEATIAAFAVRMQDAADLDEVRSDLLAVAYQVMEPAHVSIWVRSRSGQAQPRGQP
jgi:N-terminal 7TM region of histidine kinase